MKILIIPSDSLPMPPVQGGAVQTLIDDFLNWNDINQLHNITIYSIYDSTAKKKSEAYKNTEFKYISINTFRNKTRNLFRKILKKFLKYEVPTKFISLICKEIEGSDYDLIISENVIENGYFIKKVTDKPVLLHLHNEYFKKEKRHCLRYMNSFEEIITVSNYIENTIKKCDENQKVRTLYNGIDVSLFDYSQYKNEKNEIRKKYGIDPNAVVILFSARICADKGALELVTAFIKAKFDRKVQLIIVGSKTYGKNVKDKYLKSIQQVAEGKNDDIIFTGYVQHEDIPELCALADIGILPSIFDDPFPLTLIEYMTMGLPVIITKSGGMPELANDQCGVIVNRDDNLIAELSKAMERLCEDSKLRSEMSKASLNAVKMFNKERYCEEFNSILVEYS